MNNTFSYYMHEGTSAFSLELAGRLSADGASELERAWRAASSIGPARSLVVDLSYVTDVYFAGRKLLRGWYDDGAQLVAQSPQAKAIVESITGQRSELIAARARHQTWRPFRMWALSGMVIATLFLPALADAADLKPETAQAWDEYLKAAVARSQQHLVPGNSYLWTDTVPGQAARLRGGDIVVSPAGPHVPVKVPSGLIHDWVGAAFIPNVTLGDVLPVVRDYARYQYFYRPNVITSKAIATGKLQDQFSMLLMNKSVIAKMALDGDYKTSYGRLGPQRWYSISEAVRLQEVADYGSPSQRVLPEGEGSGVIWRLCSITRFEARDGGVYVELEAMALSRDIPVSLRWIVDPIVRRVSRASIETSLQQTERALNSEINRSAERGTQPDGKNSFAPSMPSGSSAALSLR